jgi:acetoin utilization deacetylase AcuC-like enzyme
MNQRATVATTRVAVADDARFLEHVAPPDHPECGERLIAARNGLSAAVAALGERYAYKHLPLAPVLDEHLARVHTPEYIESIGRLAGKSGYLDEDTYLSSGSVDAARLAAGAVVKMVDELASGQTRCGFALPRPPGHHALADRAMGFCLFNNVAVGAAHARALGRQRVLVLDWDVHHGNGTEAMFYDDANVLFISLHQFPNYPGTGAVGDVGSAEGQGKNVNLPLPPGGTDAVYAAAFERVVLPIIDEFRPDFALVSSGFDAHARDPLAQMELSERAYGNMTERLLAVVDPTCPVAVVLEGGYDLEAIAASTEAVASALLRAGGATVHAEHAQSAGSVLPREQEETLSRVIGVQKRFWRL